MYCTSLRCNKLQTILDCTSLKCGVLNYKLNLTLLHYVQCDVISYNLYLTVWCIKLWTLLDCTTLQCGVLNKENILDFTPLYCAQFNVNYTGLDLTILCYTHLKNILDCSQLQGNQYIMLDHTTLQCGVLHYSVVNYTKSYTWLKTTTLWCIKLQTILDCTKLRTVWWNNTQPILDCVIYETTNFTWLYYTTVWCN